MNTLKNIFLAMTLGIAFGLAACDDESGDKNENNTPSTGDVVVDAGTEPVVGDNDAGTTPEPVETDAGTDPIEDDAGTDPVEDDAGTDPVEDDAGTDPVEDDGGTDPEPVVIGAACDIEAEADFCDEDGNSVYCNCTDDNCDSFVWWKTTCEETETCGIIQDFYGTGLDLSACYDNELSLCQTEGEIYYSMCDDEEYGMGILDVAMCFQTSLGLRVESTELSCISDDETAYYLCDEENVGCDTANPQPFD